MNGRARNPRLVRAALAALIGLVGLSAAPANAANAASPASTGNALGAVNAAHRAAATPATPLQLALTQVSPSAVDTKSDLVVTGTVHNAGTSSVTGIKINLRLRSQRLADRDAITDWLQKGELTSYDRTLPNPIPVRDLGPGDSATFSLEVKPGQLGLSSSGSSFGPRAIAVEAKNDSGTLGVLRSTIVWSPSGANPGTRTRLSILVPITSAAASNEAGQPTDAVAQSVIQGGHLQRVLAATSDPNISWAIDPAVLASTQRMSVTGVQQSSTDVDVTDNPAAPTSSAATGSVATTSAASKASAGTWLGRLRTELAGREAFALPFADPDLSSLLSTEGSLALLRHSQSLGTAVTKQALGTALDTTIAWPGDGKVTPGAASALRRTGETAVLISSSIQPPEPDVDYTPSGHSTLPIVDRKPLTSLLYDDDLSTLVTGSGSSSDSAANIQTLLAQLAAIALERPDETRQVLAVTPRTWNPEPTGVSTMMTALEAVPWVSLRKISSLRKASTVPRATPRYSKASESAQLPVGQITGALAASRNLDVFSLVLENPDQVLEPLREQIASLLSVAWRKNRDQMSAQRQVVAGNVSKLTGGVLLATSRKYFITGRSVPIPVTVVNNTDYPVKVIIRLRPQSGQLRVIAQVTVPAAPHSRTPARVEVRGIANGDVVVEGKLLSGSGQAIGPSVDFVVQVRPNWEDVGMVGAATILGLLLVFGLLRSLRRRRRPRVPLDSVPDVDDLATRRAAQAAGRSAGGTQGAEAAPGSTAAGPDARSASSTSAL